VRRWPAHGGGTNTTKARQLAQALLAAGFDFYSFVPDSVLQDVLAALDESCAPRGIPFVSAYREDSAVGMACGAYLGGARPVVLMQNSGLGYSLNALTSLSQPFGIPLTLVIGYRGYRRLDSEETLLMGTLTEKLLAGVGISARICREDGAGDAEWAVAQNDAGRSAALLVAPPDGEVT